LLLHACELSEILEISLLHNKKDRSGIQKTMQHGMKTHYRYLKSNAAKPPKEEKSSSSRSKQYAVLSPLCDLNVNL